MRNRILSALALAGALLFLASGVCAQTQTNVTATVTDPNGIPYASGTYSIQLIPTGTNPTVNGNSIGGAFNGAMDATGSLNVSLWPNASIVPASTTWQFTICTNPGGIPLPLGTGNQCTPPTAVTISGTSKSLSATLSAVAPTLTTLLSRGTVTSTSCGSLSPLFTCSVATPTITPAISFVQTTQNANLVFAGPASGAAANPTFRNLGGADIPSGISNSSGHIIVSTNCGSPAPSYCFQVSDDVEIDNNPTWSNGSSTVTTSTNVIPFRSTGGVYPATCSTPSATCDIGKTMFGTSNCNAISPQQCFSAIPQGTITAITSAHVATVSTTSTVASVAGLAYFGWGTNDTTPLSAAADACYTSNVPCDVVLPCGNMFFDHSSFNPTRVTRGLYPIGFVGCEGAGGTELVPLPQFTCAGSTIGCFLLLTYSPGQTSVPGWSDTAENINFFGLGQDIPAAGFLTGASYTLVTQNVSTYTKNVTLIGTFWGNSAAKTIYGFECLGCRAEEPAGFVAGNKSCHLRGGTTSQVGLITNFYCAGSNLTSCTIDGTGAESVLNTAGGTCGSAVTSDGTVNSAAVSVLSGATVLWSDYKSVIGGTAYFAGGNTDWNGTSFLPTSGGGTSSAFVNNAAASLTVSHMRYGATNFTWLTQTAGTVYDDYPNFGLTTPGNAAIVTGGTYIAKGHSVNGACTGVGTASSTLFLFGSNPNAATIPCTLVTANIITVIDTPGTLQFLNASATAAGTNASSGVVTVVKNGAGTTMTCTIGTGTSCHDSAHPIAVVAGDRIAIQFTTQLADTLAGVQAFVPID